MLEEMTLEQRLEILMHIPRRELPKELLRDALPREPKRAEVDAYLRFIRLMRILSYVVPIS